MLKDGISAGEEKIYSFLMIGQSNMAGRGVIGEIEPADNANCFMLRMGRWQKISEPVNPDRPLYGIEFPSGVSLATYFADDCQKFLNAKVGLIPCADGGTKISQWQPGEILFDHAVAMSEFAMRTSEIKAILWHQGESDCGSEESLDCYKEKFITMITALRKALGNEKLPFIIGELSHNYQEDRWHFGDRPEKLNKIFYELEKELPYIKVVSAEGLEMKPDGLHFNSESLRTFGKRYFEKYMEFEEN